MSGRRRQRNFGSGIAVIAGAAPWGATSGFEQSKTSYVTVDELLRGKTRYKHTCVSGVVEKGSVMREGTTLRFRLAAHFEATGDATTSAHERGHESLSQPGLPP